MGDKNLKERLELGSVRYRNMPVSGKRETELRRILGLEGPTPFFGVENELLDLERRLLSRVLFPAATPKSGERK